MIIAGIVDPALAFAVFGHPAVIIAATVVLMAPVAIGVAKGMGYSINPFLMAVAIEGSCAFLTHIRHQSNTLLLRPGGYKFSACIYPVLPLEVIITAIGIPLIILVWPL